MHRYTEYFASQMHEHVFYGEDHMFSKRMRDMEMPMFIYPNVNITHWGYKGFEGNYHKHLKENMPKVPEEERPGLSIKIPTERLQ